MAPRITIFLTRKFPPAKGGMETFSAQLVETFPGPKTVLHFGRRQVDILWAAPRLFLSGWRLRRQATLYHLGDAVLAPVGRLLKRVTGKPVVVTVHGLELTYDAFGGLYQRLLAWSLPAIDHFVSVSEYTAQLLRERGVAPEKITVIHHGVTAPEAVDPAQARQAICAAVSGPAATDCASRPLLLTVGRLVKRKGVAWFVTNVLPELRDQNPLYLVVSDGPDRTAIEQAIKAHHLQSHVALLGKVSGDLLQQLYAGADIFVMPNLAVAGDVEGFGFVGIEAAAAGLPVVASRVDGIPAAIHHNQNGLLLPPGDHQAYAQTIHQWITDPANRAAFAARAKTYTLRQFNWPEVAQQYHTLFDRLTRPA